MPTPQTPTSLAQLQKLRTPIRNVNTEHRGTLTTLERFSLAITQHIGSMGFFFIIFVWTLGWLGWNTLAPTDVRFAPYPAFVLWLIISNMIQILLLPLLMVGQNLQGRHAEARAKADYEVNTKAEREIEAILVHLERQEKLIMDILERVKTTT